MNLLDVQQRGGYVRETNAISVKVVCNIPQCPEHPSRWPTNCRLILCTCECARSSPEVDRHRYVSDARVGSLRNSPIILIIIHARRAKTVYPDKKKSSNYDHPSPHTVNKYLNDDRRFEFFALSHNAHSIIIIINQREHPPSTMS